jgi:hypothetical protein
MGFEGKHSAMSPGDAIFMIILAPIRLPSLALKVDIGYLELRANLVYILKSVSIIMLSSPTKELFEVSEFARIFFH